MSVGPWSCAGDGSAVGAHGDATLLSPFFLPLTLGCTICCLPAGLCSSLPSSSPLLSLPLSPSILTLFLFILTLNIHRFFFH